MKRSLGLVLLLVAACALDPAESEGQFSSALLEQGRMTIYAPGKAVPQQELTVITPPGGLHPGDSFLGGTVLEGNLEIAVRIDYATDKITAGIFQVNRGKVRIFFPFTEHMTMLKGEITLTDESGQTHTFVEGESYLVKQGSTIVWETKTPYMQKTFFNVVE